jgi:hypothetical protein
MINKILGILGSVRFWIVTLTAVVGILNGQDVVTVVQVWLAAVAGIGTLDSMASRIGGK